MSLSCLLLRCIDLRILINRLLYFLLGNEEALVPLLCFSGLCCSLDDFLGVRNGNELLLRRRNDLPRLSWRVDPLLHGVHSLVLRVGSLSRIALLHPLRLNVLNGLLLRLLSVLLLEGQSLLATDLLEVLHGLLLLLDASKARGVFRFLVPHHVHLLGLVVRILELPLLLLYLMLLLQDIVFFPLLSLLVLEIHIVSWPLLAK